MIRPTGLAAALLSLAAIGSGASAQQIGQPLTNADVIKMVEAGVPESAVVSSIRSGPTNFNTTPDGLIALHKAGVTSAELDAITAAGQAGNDAASAPSAAAAPAGPRWHLPSVSFLHGGTSQELPLEKTQLAQTKSKPTSMMSLASDSLTGQALRTGIGISAGELASKMNYGVGSSFVQGAGGIFASVLTSRKPQVTYVWCVAGVSSATVLQTTTPTFALNFAKAPGVNPDDYAPQIVKLTPAQNTCRIVGATEGTVDAQSSPAADWQVYSGFLEDRVDVTATKLRTGEYKITAAAPLLPGEYAVVLRPVSKNKKFSGVDVARGQGDGQMFQLVWTFQVSSDAS